MCGICGVYHYATDRPIDRDVLARMTRAMVHRGPDDEQFQFGAGGRLGMGIRRILRNSSPTAWSENSPDRPLVVSDGLLPASGRPADPPEGAPGGGYAVSEEDLPGLWLRVGTALPVALEPACSFGLFDPRDGRLFLARDRLGLHPLYTADTGRAFLFASELKALLLHPDIAPRLDAARFVNWLGDRPCPEDQTFFAGLCCLPAGHHQSIRPGSGAAPAERYWTAAAALERGTIQDPLEAAEALRDTLRRAVRGCLPPAGGAGVLLSGGFDSSALLALVTLAQGTPPKTFTVRYDDTAGQARGAAAAAQARLFRAEHHEIHVGHESRTSNLQRWMDSLETPEVDPVGWVFGQAATLASDHGVSLVLAGTGSDELLRGDAQWDRCRRWLARRERRVASLPTWARRFEEALTQPFLPAYLRRGAASGQEAWPACGEIRQSIAADDLESLLEPDFLAEITPAPEVPPAPPEPPEDQPGAEVSRRLHAMPPGLRALDSVTQAASVHCRLPFLDPNVVELAWRIDPRLQQGDGLGKMVLRKAMGPFLPDDLAHLPRRVDAPPAWIPRGDRLARLARRVLLHEPGESVRVLARRPLSRLIERLEAGDLTVSRVAAGLVVFRYWYHHWIETNVNQSTLPFQ